MSKPVVTFLDAVKSRYGAEDDTDSYDPSAFLVGDPKLTKNKKWEFVGMEKTRKQQSQYAHMYQMVLRDCGITVTVQEPEENCEEKGSMQTQRDAALEEANMVRLRELDLSENTELTLQEIGKLLSYLPSLQTLQLCDIPRLLLCAPSPSSALLSSKTITKVVLNHSGFRSMAQLVALVELPHLQELHLDNNSLRSLDMEDAEHLLANAKPGSSAAVVMPTVTTLSLAHNQIDNWEGMGRTIAAAFPKLINLFLTDNALPDLVLPSAIIMQSASDEAAKQENAPYAYLWPLQLLCLNDNATITNTRTLDALRMLCPSLSTFRISYQHLLPTWNETLARMFVVASLPTITMLNRGTVRAKERLDSELLYIQRGRAEQEDAKQKGGEAGETRYPLLSVLHEKHKDVVLAIYKEGTTASTDGTSHMMIPVTIHFENAYKKTNQKSSSSETDSATTLKKTLPSSLSVGKLKALVHMAFQIEPVHQVLTFRSGDDGVLMEPVPLDNETQSLSYFGVAADAIIYVTDSSLRH